MLALSLAMPARAQTAGGPVVSQGEPQSPHSPGGGGGIGFGITLDLGRKTPKPPPAPIWEMADADIPDRVPRQLIVLFSGPADNAAATARAARVTLIEEARLESIGVVMAVVSLSPGDSPEAASARLAKLRGVEAVQPNYQFQSLGGKLPRRFSLVGITKPEQLRASGVVAMIDTPIDTASLELRGAAISQTVFGTSAAPAAHGTAIASLIVGTGAVQGMAQGARLISLAAFDPDAAATGISQTRYIARAMDAAWRLRPDVLNLSFGGREDPLLSRVISALDRRGVCMAGAVGNGGPASPVLFPARHPAVLAVTAVDERLRIYPHAAQGPQVAISGVGVGLLAAVPGGYRQVSGTSFATASVSALLLRMPACAAAHDPAAMRRQVIAQAQDLGQPGPDPVFGAGLLRLSAAKK